MSTFFQNPIHYYLSMILTFSLTNFSWAHGEEKHHSIINQLHDITSKHAPEGSTHFCITNHSLKNDLTLLLHTHLNVLKETEFNAVTVDLKTHDYCVNVDNVRNKDSESYLYLKHFFEKNYPSVDVELRAEKGELPLLGNSTELKDAPIQKFSLYLRGALKGMANGALTTSVFNTQRELFKEQTFNTDQSSTEISIGNGAIIGGLIDVLQRISGRVDEYQIQKTTAVLTAAANFAAIKEGNATYMSILLTLSQSSYIDDVRKKLSEQLPRKLDWKIAAGTVAVFYALSHKFRNDPFRIQDADKYLGIAGYGTYSLLASYNHQNQTLAFLETSLVSLIDEACDGLTKKCRGTFSFGDLTANTIGAALGAYIGSYLPKDFFLQLYRNKISAGYRLKL